MNGHFLPLSIHLSPLLLECPSGRYAFQLCRFHLSSFSFFPYSASALLMKIFEESIFPFCKAFAKNNFPR